MLARWATRFSDCAHAGHTQGGTSKGQALGFQGLVELLDAEWGAGTAEQVALDQAEGDVTGNAVALDDIPQNGDIDVSLRSRDPIVSSSLVSFRRWRREFSRVGALKFLLSPRR